MCFIIKCTACGQEQKFGDNDSCLGNKIEIKPAAWGGALYLELNCKNPKCKESINFESA